MQKKLPLTKYLDLLPKETQEKVVSHVQARNLRLPDMEVKRIGNEPIRRKPSEADMATLQSGEMAVIHYVSTRDMDLDREVVMPAGAVLDAFKSWPQVYENHDLRKPPIGKDEWIEADEYGVRAKTVYAPTQRGKDFWALRSGGFLNSSSIGFVPLESHTKGGRGWNEAMAACSQWPEFKDAADKIERITTKWLMVEHSDAWEPCNRHALTLAVAGKSLDLSDEAVKSLCDELALEVAKTGVPWVEQKPYPQEHAARLRQPDEFEPDSFRRVNDKFGAGIHGIFGRLKGQDGVVLQAIRFDKDKFKADEARKWLAEHNHKAISFEPAEGKAVQPQKPPERSIRPVVKLISGPRLVRLAPEYIEQEARRLALEQLALLRGKV